MSKVAVCICTYNRPAGLRLLCDALSRQYIKGLHAYDVAFVIVDNGETGNARQYCASVEGVGRYEFVVVHEKRRGLVFARNAAIEAARQIKATLVAFIDDDEVPDPNWLESLVTALIHSGAPAAIGPVHPIFAAPPSKWLPLTAYAMRRVATDGLVEDGYTCNVIMKMSCIDEHKLRFNHRFNETGGEDTLFFQAWRRCGLTIAWAPKAIVYEFVPSSRMTPAWLFRRWYRTGNIEAHLSAYDVDTLKGRLFNLARGAMRVVWGGGCVLASALLHARRPEKIVANSYTVCRGAGLIASVFGRNFKEYSRPTYR